MKIATKSADTTNKQKSSLVDITNKLNAARRGLGWVVYEKQPEALSHQAFDIPDAAIVFQEARTKWSITKVDAQSDKANSNKNIDINLNTKSYRIITGIDAGFSRKNQQTSESQDTTIVFSYYIEQRVKLNRPLKEVTKLSTDVSSNSRVITNGLLRKGFQVSARGNIELKQSNVGWDITVGSRIFSGIIAGDIKIRTANNSSDINSRVSFNIEGIGGFKPGIDTLNVSSKTLGSVIEQLQQQLEINQADYEGEFVHGIEGLTFFDEDDDTKQLVEITREIDNHLDEVVGPSNHLRQKVSSFRQELLYKKGECPRDEQYIATAKQKLYNLIYLFFKSGVLFYGDQISLDFMSETPTRSKSVSVGLSEEGDKELLDIRPAVAKLEFVVQRVVDSQTHFGSFRLKTESGKYLIKAPDSYNHFVAKLGEGTCFDSAWQFNMSNELGKWKLCNTGWSLSSHVSESLVMVSVADKDSAHFKIESPRLLEYLNKLKTLGALESTAHVENVLSCSEQLNKRLSNLKELSPDESAEVSYFLHGALPKIFNVKGREVNFVIGNMGVGKSTLINMLLGHEMELNSESKLEFKNGQLPSTSYAEMSGEYRGILGGHTKLIASYDSPFMHKLSYIDTAGLGDKIDSMTGYSLKMLHHNSAATKSIIVVMPYSNLVEIHSRKDLENLMKTLSNLVRAPHNITSNHYQYISSNLVFVINTFGKNIAKNEILEAINKNISSLAKSIGKKVLDGRQKAMQEYEREQQRIEEQGDDSWSLRNGISAAFSTVNAVMSYTGYSNATQQKLEQLKFNLQLYDMFCLMNNENVIVWTSHKTASIRNELQRHLSSIPKPISKDTLNFEELGKDSDLLRLKILRWLSRYDVLLNHYLDKRQEAQNILSRIAEDADRNRSNAHQALISEIDGLTSKLTKAASLMTDGLDGEPAVIPTLATFFELATIPIKTKPTNLSFFEYFYTGRRMLHADTDVVQPSETIGVDIETRQVNLFERDSDNFFAPRNWIYKSGEIEYPSKTLFKINYIAFFPWQNINSIEIGDIKIPKFFKPDISQLRPLKLLSGFLSNLEAQLRGREWLDLDNNWSHKKSTFIKSLELHKNNITNVSNKLYARPTEEDFDTFTKMYQQLEELPVQCKELISCLTDIRGDSIFSRIAKVKKDNSQDTNAADKLQADKKKSILNMDSANDVLERLSAEVKDIYLAIKFITHAELISKPQYNNESDRVSFSDFIDTCEEVYPGISSLSYEYDCHMRNYVNSISRVSINSSSGRVVESSGVNHNSKSAVTTVTVPTTNNARFFGHSSSIENETQLAAHVIDDEDDFEEGEDSNSERWHEAKV